MSLVITLVYAVVTFVATTLGAVAGLGGGVIIKPLLDLVGAHDAATVNTYSSIAVFVMCCVSLTRQLRAGFAIDARVVLPVAAGSLLGGFVGERAFSALTAALDGHLVRAVQAGTLSVVLALILVYTLLQDKLPHGRLTSIPAIFASGILLGAAAVFLGIGGGPLNVCALALLFSLGAKEGAVYSLAIIFFSQLAKLALAATSGRLATIDVTLLFVVVVCAVAGGFVGTHFNRRLSEEGVRRVYLLVMAALPLVSLYTCVVNLAAL